MDTDFDSEFTSLGSSSFVMGQSQIMFTLDSIDYLTPEKCGPFYLSLENNSESRKFTLNPYTGVINLAESESWPT